MMSDTELLDRLQFLFRRRIVVLRSCRSGVKLEVSHGPIRYADEHEQSGPHRVFSYYGGINGEDYGDNIRAAIERGVIGEVEP